jgi:hypothetical protein
MFLGLPQSYKPCRPSRRLRNTTALVIGLAAMPFAAAAQQSAPAAQPPQAVPPVSAMTNLIRQLVQEGVLTQERAEALIHQAQDEAAIAARAGQVPVIDARGGTSVRVPYIPQFVKNQIRDEVKEDVLREAREQNWAAPGQVPTWTQRIRMLGDFRLRYEWNMFDPRNSNAFPNFAALNGPQPFNLNNAEGTPPPITDTTHDRQRMRVRARIGIEADVTDDLFMRFRLATGNTLNPVTTNQTLGSTLNKQDITLDQVFLDYHPSDWMEVWAGRFANPWMSTELVWDEDIAFDGVAARLTGKVATGLSVFTTAGAFPIENTSFNFPDHTVNKVGSRDKWLYAAQMGLDWQLSRSINVRMAAAYNHFQNIEGKLSAPCVANSQFDPCNTDLSRPGFQQQGNTLFAIRNLVSNAVSPPLFQYYGLATPFHDVDLTARVDASVGGDAHLIIDGDVVKNVAYSVSKIRALNPVNNLGPNVTNTQGNSVPGAFDGGSLGYQARILFGYPEIHERWQWNFNATYKYLESDAVPDAFTDSDFHVGGTNAKGYIIGATLGLAHSVDLTARWLSAREITSLPYTVDVVQVDLNARF